jgi:MFS family permease
VSTEHDLEAAGYRQLLQAGFREAFSNQAIFFILLITTLLLVAFGVYDEFVPPVLQENNFTLAQVAFLAAPIYLAQALGNALAGRFDFLSMGQLLAIMATAALVLLAAASASGLWVTFYLCGFFLIFGLASSVVAGKLQQQIQGPARATVTSTIGLGDGIGAILWFMIFGLVADSSSMIYASGVLAILMLASCSVFYWLARTWRLT